MINILCWSHDFHTPPFLGMFFNTSCGYHLRLSASGSKCGFGFYRIRSSTLPGYFLDLAPCSTELLSAAVATANMKRRWQFLSWLCLTGTVLIRLRRTKVMVTPSPCSRLCQQCVSAPLITAQGQCLFFLPECVRFPPPTAVFSLRWVVGVRS